MMCNFMIFHSLLLWRLDEERSDGEMKNEYKILVGKLQVRRPLERPTRKWENNIKIYLKVTD